jgi:hypothetical protein
MFRFWQLLLDGIGADGIRSAHGFYQKRHLYPVKYAFAFARYTSQIQKLPEHIQLRRLLRNGQCCGCLPAENGSQKVATEVAIQVRVHYAIRKGAQATIA